VNRCESKQLFNTLIGSDRNALRLKLTDISIIYSPLKTISNCFKTLTIMYEP